MTTEEFHGHLMAALHGPKADEVAMRVFELTIDGLSQPDTREVLAKQADGLIEACIDMVATSFGIHELARMVQALAVLAVADNAHVRDGATGGEFMANAQRKITMAKVVKARARALY